jgi:hypothetical protein
LDARLNLGATLAQLQLNPEALAMFDEVLAHSPTNALALKYARALRQKHSARGASVTNSPP